MKRNYENECRNVFKNGRSEPVREHFTEVWISLINGIERGKESTNVHRG